MAAFAIDTCTIFMLIVRRDLLRSRRDTKNKKPKKMRDISCGNFGGQSIPHDLSMQQPIHFTLIKSFPVSPQ